MIWHSDPLPRVLEELNAAPETGLTEEEARTRQESAEEKRLHTVLTRTVCSPMTLFLLLLCAAEAVDGAVEQIGQATGLANDSGMALQEIVATVEATADQVNAIATASEEQSAASEEINQSIVQVNDMSRQTAEAMAEAAKAVSDLAAQAQGLTDLIQELKEA